MGVHASCWQPQLARTPRSLPYCPYGLRVPAARVLYVPEAQGGLPPGPHVLYVLGVRASLGRAVRTAFRGYHPQALR